MEEGGMDVDEQNHNQNDDNDVGGDQEAPQVDSPEQVKLLRGGITLLAYSAAKDLLALTHDKHLRITERSGKILLQDQHAEPIRAVVFSGDGKLLVTVGDDKKLCVWCCEKFVRVEQRDIQKRPTACVFVTNDPPCVAVSNKAGDVFTFDLGEHSSTTTHTKKEATSQFGHYSIVTDLTMLNNTPNSAGFPPCIASCDRDEKIRITQTSPDFLEIQSFCLGHTEFVSRVCWSPKSPSLLLSGGGDRTLRLWDHTTGALLHTTHIPKTSHEVQRDNDEDERTGTMRDKDDTCVSVLVCSHSSKVVLVGMENSCVLRVFELDDTKPELTAANSLEICHPPTSAVFISPTEFLIACTCGHTTLCNTATWERICSATETSQATPFLPTAKPDEDNPFVTPEQETQELAALILPEFRRKFGSKEDWDEFKEMVETRIRSKKTKAGGQEIHERFMRRKKA